MNSGSGGYAWITATPILNRAGLTVGAIESIRDVTHIKHVEKRVLDSERKLSTLMLSTWILCTPTEKNLPRLRRTCRYCTVCFSPKILMPAASLKRWPCWKRRIPLHDFVWWSKGQSMRLRWD